MRAKIIERKTNGGKPHAHKYHSASVLLNLKTAKQIGLTIPQRTLMKATKVIQ